MTAISKLQNSAFGKRYLGNKAFYMTVLGLIVPIIVQNSISNFVSLLDNIMVGADSTAQMSGVSIANNLIFIYTLTIFGGMSAATIFAAQYYGAGDENGVRYSFRYSMYVGVAVTVIATAILGFFTEELVQLFINDVENTGGGEETLQAASNYVKVMLLGLFPFAVSQAYAGILRVEGEAKLPMVASIASVLINLVLNYVFIFGHLGFEPMHAKGAAVATVIARYVEMLMIVLVAHYRQKRYSLYMFLDGAYRSLTIPVNLLKKILIRGVPLLLNEALWSLGMTTLNQQYSLRGLNVVAALTVATTLSNLFTSFYLSMGTAVSVMVGRTLGSADMNESRTMARKLIAFDIFLCVFVGLAMYALAPLLPAAFTETDADVRAIAKNMIRVYALSSPLIAFANCAYFTLRAGGRTVITFLFDSAYTWVVPLPLVFLLVNFTSLEIIPIYAAYYASDIVKVVIGYILLKKGIWIRNIVSELRQENANEEDRLGSTEKC